VPGQVLDPNRAQAGLASVLTALKKHFRSMKMKILVAFYLLDLQQFDWWT
jgi:hypothetical protein